jgi:hypothetical protein
MIHRPASPQPRAGRRIPRTHRALTPLSGLAVFLTAAVGLAPAASATRVPPGPSGPPAAPPPPPATTAAAHFPLWAVITIVAASVVLSVATTLVTLSLDRMRQARRIPAAAAEPHAGAQTPAATAGPGAEHGEMPSPYQDGAGHDMHQADSR